MFSCSCSGMLRRMLISQGNKSEWQLPDNLTWCLQSDHISKIRKVTFLDRTGLASGSKTGVDQRTWRPRRHGPDYPPLAVTVQNRTTVDLLWGQNSGSKRTKSPDYPPILPPNLPPGEESTSCTRRTNQCVLMVFFLSVRPTTMS